MLRKDERLLVAALAAVVAASCKGSTGNGPTPPEGDEETGGSGRLPIASGGAGGAAAAGGAAGAPSVGGAGGRGTTDGAAGDLAGAGTAARGGSDAAAGAGGVGGGGAGGAGGSPVAAGASVLERNRHPSRDGHFVEPTLTKARAAKMALDGGFKATFTGNMWASPLYVEKGPAGKGVFFAVTTGNDVFALDETTGAVIWMKNIGPSPMNTGVSCGNIHPIGIISTPVIDAGTRTIYVAGAVGRQVIERHEVHALSIDDGAERPGWPVDVSRATSGALKFAAPPHNQRSALSLVGGVVYVAYGGHAGDCGPYHGWVVAIDTRNPTQIAGWATRDGHSGIWAPGGLASDGTSVFAVTGNGGDGSANHLDSEQVVRLTGLGMLDRKNENVFFPRHWRAMDSADADFAAVNPMVVEISGATPSSYVVAAAKDGHMYFLDLKNLGGEGGAVVDFKMSPGNPDLHTAPTAYRTAKGTYIALTSDRAPPCPVPAPAVVSVFVAPGAPPKPEIAWCAPIGGTASPIATTTDGKSDAIVWFVSGGKLRGVDGDTGATVFDGGSGVCAAVRKWTSPIAVKGRIVAGADGHLCSWSWAP